MRHSVKTRHGVLALLLANLVGAIACLNPAFVNRTTGGSVVPVAPGNTPYNHVIVINGTATRTMDVTFSWEPALKGKITTYLMGDVAPEEERGFVLPCPLTRIGLGDVNNLTLPAIILKGTSGGTTAVNVPATAFPRILVNGAQYNCGDTIVFTVVDDIKKSYGIDVVTGIVPASVGVGQFSGPDTYQLLDYLMQLNNPAIPIQ